MGLVELPALRSDDPLGMLGALGLVEVCSSGLGLAVRLGWDGVGGPALLECSFDSTGALAGAIHKALRSWAAEGRVVPVPDPAFISKRKSDRERREEAAQRGTKAPNDPMRMEQRAAVSRFSEQQDRELEGDGVGARWLAAMVSQLGLVEKGSPICDLTPLYAPAGQQTLHQLYDKYTGLVASDPRWVREALSGWRRTPADTGANLDYRDVRDAVASAQGDPENAGVPGAAWLALQSVPFFRLIGDGRRGTAVGWMATGKGGRPRAFFWPVWRPLLDSAAIGVLFEHPTVRAAVREADPRAGTRRAVTSAADKRAAARAPRDRRQAFEALGVVAVLCSRRRVGRNSDGPLQAAAMLWP